jgi:hypothetical protein
MCLHMPLLLRVRILPQWQTKRQPHLTSILSHQVARKERNMHNRDQNMTSPSQSVSKEIINDSKPNYKNLLPIIQSLHRQAATSPTLLLPSTHSYSKTVHVVLLRAPNNSIHVHFVFNKTFLIPSR